MNSVCVLNDVLDLRSDKVSYLLVDPQQCVDQEWITYFTKYNKNEK